MAAESLGSTSSRKSGLLSRSGLTRRTSTSPAATSAWTVSHSSVFDELIVRARMPARAAASTWLRISASSGETITVGPLPRSRSSEVATKYTADLPQPVRWTTSARRPPATSASMARHWSSRSRAAPVGSPTRRARTASAAVRRSVVLVSFMPPYNRTGLTSGPSTGAPGPAARPRAGRYGVMWSERRPSSTMSM